MSTENKTASLITKLIRGTAKGLIKWEVKNAPGSLNFESERSVPLYLQTKYKGKLLGIYNIRAKHFYDEHAFHWTESIGFCIVDRMDRVLWESDEYSPALQDLFNTAREQASGINDILNSLLDEQDT